MVRTVSTPVHTNIPSVNCGPSYQSYLPFSSCGLIKQEAKLASAHTEYSLLTTLFAAVLDKNNTHPVQLRLFTLHLSLVIALA